MRRVLFALTATVSIALIGSVSRAGDWVAIPQSLMTGQKYLALSETHRTAYVVGLVDGISVGLAFDASEARVDALHQCLVGRSTSQMGAILSKYIQDRPDRWHEGAHMLFYSRMLELCPGVKPK
jgi:hypothetical protein